MIALTTYSFAAYAQGRGDSAKGLALAQRLCADCHSVTPGAAGSPPKAAADFETIANTPGMTDLALSVWLRTPHRQMPNLQLSDDQRTDLIAYIASLRKN